MSNNTIPTLAEFYDMLERHDWTWQMSDDWRVWDRGATAERDLSAVMLLGGPTYADLHAAYEKYAWGYGHKPESPKG